MRLNKISNQEQLYVWHYEFKLTRVHVISFLILKASKSLLRSYILLLSVSLSLLSFYSLSLSLLLSLSAHVSFSSCLTRSFSILYVVHLSLSLFSLSVFRLYFLYLPWYLAICACVCICLFLPNSLYIPPFFLGFYDFLCLSSISHCVRSVSLFICLSFCFSIFLSLSVCVRSK